MKLIMWEYENGMPEIMIAVEKDEQPSKKRFRMGKKNMQRAIKDRVSQKPWFRRGKKEERRYDIDDQWS